MTRLNAKDLLASRDVVSMFAAGLRVLHDARRSKAHPRYVTTSAHGSSPAVRIA
ncbi:MAG: hypothetical protein ACYC19_09255 [Acidimicrobiales bacterium]